VDASEKYRDDLLDYYVLLCGNQQFREHAVRKVLSDFVGIERVRVVEPMYALGFLNLQPRDFDAILRACLGDSDPLLRAAKSVLAPLTFTQASLLLRCLVNHVEGGPPLRLQDLIADRHIAAQYELALSLGLENDFRIAPSIIIPEEFKRERPYPSVSEVVAADLDVVSEQLVANEDSELVLSTDWLEAILALAYEGAARAEYRGHELLEYLETLLLPSGASDSARRDALSLALTSMMDGGVNDEAEDIAVLLQANFDRPSDAMRLLLPASLVADLEPIDETEAGFENVGQALIDLLSDYQSLEDAWNDL
jgi:hypothetical protein